MPLQDPFPLWVGGNSAAGIARAALEGNGWHPLFPTPEAYRAGRERILHLREEAGLTERFTFAMSCPGTQVVVDPSAMSGASDLGGYEDVPDEYGYAPAFPSVDGRPMFVGEPAQLADDVRAYAAVGVEHLALRFWTVDPSVTVDGVIDQMRLWQERVAPLV
jgi:alkanesulfonate monooxygenase SsuD/methylene tetrahydromethanopterin reductase-like flavin-dependent oxidoreductase (luciferase family)